MTEEDVRNIIDDSTSNKILTLDDENHTISSDEYYDTYIFTNLTANRYLYLPAYSNYPNKRIKVINLTGSYYAIVTPNGTDTINGYNSTVEITEIFGWWEFLSTSNGWIGITDGNSTIYEISTTTSVTLTNTSGVWEDALTLSNLEIGTYIPEIKMYYHYGRNTNYSEYIILYIGLGITSGNNAPDIPGNYFRDGVYLTADYLERLHSNQNFNSESYNNTSVKSIYAKTMFTSDESMTTHTVEASATSPFSLRMRRIK